MVLYKAISATIPEKILRVVTNRMQKVETYLLCSLCFRDIASWNYSTHCRLLIGRFSRTHFKMKVNANDSKPSCDIHHNQKMTRGFF